jgi:hypothetical protein
VNEYGAVNGWPSSRTWRPVGLVASVICAVRGCTSRNVDEVSLPESVTVKWMRYQTFASVCPVVGIVNEPLVAPLVGGMNGWV